MYTKTFAIAALAAVASAAPQLDGLDGDIPDNLESAVEAIFSTGMPVALPSVLPSTYANAAAIETYFQSVYAPLRSALPSSLLGEYDSVVSSVFRVEASQIAAAQSNPAAITSLARSVDGLISSATRTAPPMTSAPSASQTDTARPASGSTSAAGNANAAGAHSSSATGTSTGGAMPTANAGVLKVAGLAGAAVGAAALFL